MHSTTLDAMDQKNVTEIALSSEADKIVKGIFTRITEDYGFAGNGRYIL